MRVLGFSQKWGKLEQDTFTTFRLPRRDRDWTVRENVRIVCYPRSPKHEFLGLAQIIEKETKPAASITNQEAIEDGFPGGRVEMWCWLFKAQANFSLAMEINKLTIKWENKY